MIRYIYEHNFNTSNYFLISKILQKINFYFLYFYLPLRQNFLTKNFGEIDLKNQKQIFYQLHYYEEITQNQQLTLKNHTLLQKISYFFYHSLYNLKLLCENNIVLNFNNQNIIYFNDTFYFTNFFHSFINNTFSYHYGKQIFGYTHIYSSLESFILHYLFNEKERNSMFLKQDQQKIIDTFKDKQVIFSLFDNNFKQKFINEYIHHSDCFLNYNIEKYIDFLLSQSKSWDVFSVSSYFFDLYFMMLERNNDKFNDFLQNNFINFLKNNQIELFHIFHPDCTKRIKIDYLHNILRYVYVK